MSAIIYTSESGYTKKYAELLSQRTGLAIYELKSIKNAKIPKGESVIYLGWLMAGKIKGYKKASKLFDVRAVCAVGMAAPGMQSPEKIKQQNNLSGTPFFYMQGGFDINKLHGIHKLMMNIMAKTVGKKLENKSDKTADEADMLEMLTKGGDHVREENLADVLAWFEAQPVSSR